MSGFVRLRVLAAARAVAVVLAAERRRDLKLDFAAEGSFPEAARSSRCDCIEATHRGVPATHAAMSELRKLTADPMGGSHVAEMEEGRNAEVELDVAALPRHACVPRRWPHG
jgi:hypothetical protein